MKPLEVVVQASDPITRAGAISFLRSRPDLRVLPDAERMRAAVLVVMEDFVSDEVIALMRQAGVESSRPGGPHVVVITDHFREADLMTAVECGVVAILPRRETGGSKLISTVLSAGDGTAHLPPKLQGALLGQLQRMRQDVLEPNGLTLSGLASRERDVLRLVADGFGTEEIASKLSYSERTVKNVLYALMTRFNLNNRAHAVAYALRAGAI